ncbi:TonB-dependent receptor domain-containing protein [Sphingomonas colocasiae]|nr:TonB-dependent receptor [Sphingomonas colocasiae]
MKSALDAFVRQSGRQVIYRMEDVRPVRTRGAKGQLGVIAALDRLLAGSDLASYVDASGAVAIRRRQGAAAGQPAATDAVAMEGPAAEEAPAIVVTGSRIQRVNVESPVPVTTMRGEEFFQTGNTSVGEVLNEMPSFRSTVTQANSTRILGGSGLNLLDLRGLGTDRTLVLQNGRRHIAGSPNGSAPDVNAIPTELIERVDIVTGGSSAVYGSDAIAGVVNFVLKRDFEGLRMRGQGGISRYGDAGQYFLSATAGTNFGDGRGNVVVSAEFAKQDDWYASQRPDYNRLTAYLQVDQDAPGLPNGSDGVPDRRLFSDIRYLDASNGGQYVVLAPGADGHLPAYLFQPDGSLVLQTGDRIGLAPFGFYQGGNGSNLQEGRQLGLAPDVRRYSINLLSHFTVSEAFEPFIEAKFVRSDALGSSVGPFFSIADRSPRESYRTDNPYLSAAAADLIRQTMGIPAGQDAPFYFARNFLELGTRQEATRRDTWRVVGGARGRFNGDWRYEASVNVAEVDTRTRILGNVDMQRYLLAIDTVRDPATDRIVCRSTLNPAAARTYEGATNQAFAAGRLAADVAACAPLNPFGEGNISQAAKDYLLTDSIARSKLSQFVFNAFVNGDSSDWFELPGGPVGFAIGAEYRRERLRNTQDPLVEAGLTFYTPAPAFRPPAFEVKEVFGEISLPLLANQPFFRELTVNAAARAADYRGRAGTVLAWNGGVEWAPVDDLRFRANYATAVRAPNQVEVYRPYSQRYSAGLISDPCSVQNIGAGSSTRAANCRAAGVPDGFDKIYMTSFPYQSGGNPELREERSKSLTAGLVFQPRWIRGLSLTVDYYDIKVDDVITSPGVQQVLNACYDAAGIDNQFCRSFSRNIGSAPGPNGEKRGEIIQNSLTLGPLNYAALKTRGVDIGAAFRRKIADVATIGLRLNYTHVLQNDAFLNPETPERADRNLEEIGYPRNAFNLAVDIERGPITLGYQLKYVGRMTPGAIENIKSVQGRPAEDLDAFDVRYLPSVVYHDVRLSFDVDARFNTYVGVDNLGNRRPPAGLVGITPGSGVYSNIGRFFYVGAAARF